MGKRKLITGMVVGALIGGVVALFDRETRGYTKQKLSSAKSASLYCLKNPSEAVGNFKQAFDQLHENVTYQAENAINALEQVEETLGKVTNRIKKIEAE